MVPPSHIAYELLAKAHPPEAAAAVFTDKVLHKPLHLQPSSLDPNSRDARAQRRLDRVRKQEKIKRRSKVKPFSAKEKRISEIYDIPKHSCKYEIYEPIHQMWLDYMKEILGFEVGKTAYVSAQNKGSILASADYHGAQVLVVRAKCAGLVGLEGIVVKDTKFTFQLITKRNELKIIPKKHTVFRFEIPQSTISIDDIEEPDRSKTYDHSASLEPLVFEIHGSQFENRATDRSTKKFKQRFLKDI